MIMTIAPLPARTDAPDRLPDFPADLVSALGAPSTRASSRPADLGRAFANVDAQVVAWLKLWRQERLPAFSAVREIAPAGGHGILNAAPTAADGAVRLTANLYDAPGRVGDPLVWSRNWASTTSLPAAPEDGRLFYRFRVSSRLVLDGQAAASAVSTSLHFGIVGNSAKSTPFRANGFTTPVARPFTDTQARPETAVDASQVIEGSVAVRAGDVPSVAFVLGTDIALADGWIRLYGGSGSWIGPAEPGGSGTIEFRYAPTSILRRFSEITLGS
jgi:hypothetical protein